MRNWRGLIILVVIGLAGFLGWKWLQSKSADQAVVTQALSGAPDFKYFEKLRDEPFTLAGQSEMDVR